MSWRRNFSEGFYRLAIVLGTIAAIVFGLIFLGNSIISGIIAAAVAFSITVGLVAVIHYILKGFIGD